MQAVAWIVTRDREITALAADNPPRVDGWITESEVDKRFSEAIEKLKNRLGRDPSKEELIELKQDTIS
jgi:hypothetical protein